MEKYGGIFGIGLFGSLQNAKGVRRPLQSEIRLAQAIEYRGVCRLVVR